MEGLRDLMSPEQKVRADELAEHYRNDKNRRTQLRISDITEIAEEYYKKHCGGNLNRITELNMLIRCASYFGLSGQVITYAEELGRIDPWHDEGNATNHRISQCTERCK